MDRRLRRTRLALLALLSTGILAGCRSEPPTLSLEPARGAATAAPRADDAPRVVALDPPQGATDVDPARKTLSVTFDREMDPEGWAWVTESEATAPAIDDSSWDPTLRTRTANVRLEPGRDYVVWVNSEQYPYFRGRDGTPATPVRWVFSTRKAPEVLPAHAPSLAGAPPARP